MQPMIHRKQENDVAKRIRWTDELIAARASKYKTRKAFEQGDRNAYAAADRRGILDQVCAHMIAQRVEWTDEMLAAKAREYGTRGAFKKGCLNAYDAALRHGIMDQICSHMEAQLTEWTPEDIAEEALNYESRKEFSKRCQSAYQAARRLGILNQVCAHMDVQYVFWTADMVRKEAPKYSTRADFKRENRKAYNAARRLGILDQVCAHMEYNSASDNDAVYIWKAEGEPFYKIGVTSQRLGEIRINLVAKEAHMSPEWIRIFPVAKSTAPVVEKQMLAHGKPVNFNRAFDGSTEFRELTPAELERVVAIAKSNVDESAEVA